MSGVVNPITRARVLLAIRDAGRPITQGEFRMFRSWSGLSTERIQAAFDSLEADGLVGTFRGKDLRGRQDCTFYALRMVI